MYTFTLPLYPDGAIPYFRCSDEQEEHTIEPGPHGEILIVRKVQSPTITTYLPHPDAATGDAVVICPGGGYQVLAYDWEGKDIAERWVDQGVAAIVLKYRLPSAVSQTRPELSPLADVQRALRLVRFYAEEWNIRGAVGVMGFSAGGHLASTVSTQYDHGDASTEDPVARVSCQPDFSILVYSVISFSEAFTHVGSRNNLLCDSTDPEAMKRFSAELNVTAETSPTLLIHASDDLAVPCEHSRRYEEALRAKGVSATLHLYPRGGHGFSLASHDPFLATWMERCFEWVADLRRMRSGLGRG